MAVSLSPSEASAQVKTLAHGAGFDLVRITDAEPLHVERARYLQWIAAGRSGGMGWINDEWANRSSDPRAALPDAASVVCVGLGYWSSTRSKRRPGDGLVARYAWKGDYHVELGGRLKALAAILEAEMGSAHRWFVDTGPAMDKALAVRAGIGWYGKHTNVITPQLGSWLFLGEIITTLSLAPDTPMARDCGSCRLCMVACPTGALGPDYSIDARKCISYLTIEHRGPIPRELRAQMGAWVFGCDICQDVCPPGMEPYLKTPDARREWAGSVRYLLNGARSDASGSVAERPSEAFGYREAMDLRWLLHLTHEEYLEAFRGSAIRRAKVWMLRRNAAIALGNTGSANDLPYLAAAMHKDEHPIVRGHAAWAIGEIGKRCAVSVEAELKSALVGEQDESVRDEIVAALYSELM